MSRCELFRDHSNIKLHLGLHGYSLHLEIKEITRQIQILESEIRSLKEQNKHTCEQEETLEQLEIQKERLGRYRSL